MNLTPNQHRALNIDRHICVTAGAGSGKTTVLVDRYLEILKQDNITPEQVVAITFTDKAAAEMKGRIIAELNKPRHVEIRTRHIEQMNAAPISTIHSFCAKILREFPFQAGVPANFNIVQGIDQKLLLSHTIQENLRGIATDPNHLHYNALRLSLQRYGNRKDIIDLLTTMIENREIVDKLLQSVYSERDDGNIPEKWQEFFFSQLPSETEIDDFIHSMFEVLNIAKGKNTTKVEILNSELERLPDRDPSSPDVQSILNEITELIANKNGSINKPQFLGNKTDITTVEAEVNILQKVIMKIQSAPSIDNEDTESDDMFMLETSHYLLTLYQDVLNAYQNNKLAQGKLDFTDLQLVTRDLLKSDETVRNQLSGRHNYYMIDEFQDTNEVQYELVMLLTDRLQDANLFIVGDPKQSIFGFRGADVRIFNKARTKIEENGGENIELKENFRSLRKPIGFVNHFFECLMGDGSQSEYDVPFEALTKARDANVDGSVEILLGNKGGEVDEYQLITQHINRTVAAGTKYEHIAILIRSRTHLPDLEAALITAGIPYLTTGGIGFYQRQEIYDIWNYLNFLNNPEKNHTSLIGILRGPAFCISDSELYEIYLQNGPSFWEKANSIQSPSHELERAIEIISNQIQFVHRMSVNLLIQKIVNETGLIGTLNIGVQGQQKWANYQKLLELARQYDSEEYKHALSDFIDFLDILITEEPREGQAQIENTSGSVEIMTVHSAKGKQFPVVILPSLHRRGASTSAPFIDEEVGIGFTPLKPDERYAKSEPEIVDMMKNRAHEKDEAEKKRLFYVATTRAKDSLVLSGALNAYGKTDNLLRWLYEHLGINIDDDFVDIAVEVDEYSDRTTTTQQGHLHIPIITRLDESINIDNESFKTTSVDFPEPPIQSLNREMIDSAYSVTELVNYYHCPLRYKLEHVLRIPTRDNIHIDRKEAELNRIIRNVILQLRSKQDIQNLSSIISRTIEKYSELNSYKSATELTDIIMNHVQNFCNSEISEVVFTSSERKNNHYIHANLDRHIISAQIDRLFKEPSGHWQGLNFITNNLNGIEYYEPEMELIGLLIHQSYPEQQSISVNYFNTMSNVYRAVRYNNADFQSICYDWQETVKLLQRENGRKNLSHCSSCQYADTQGRCIVN